jgi:MYXO-CTERM domain-containing protein
MRRGGKALLLALLAAGAVAAACSTPPSSGASGATSRAPGPAPVAKPALTVLTRNLHPLARPELDQGRRNAVIPAAGSIYFKPSPQQRAARDALVAAVQDPTSPAYHHWLGADEYANRFGARPADIARVSRWLASQGLLVDGPSRIGTRLGFRGTTGQVEAAFHTEIHDYLVAGKSHFAMAIAPSVPTELADVVLGLHGFHDFRPQAPKHPAPQYKDTQGALTLAPSDFATLYDTKPLLAAGTNGAGVNLVIVGQTYYAPSDIAGFRATFDPGYAGTLTDVLVPGTGTSAVNDQGDEVESSLDLEWSGAVAPGAHIVFVYTGNDTDNYSVGDAVAYAIEQGDALVPGGGGAQIISESYGGCELQVPVQADIDGEIASAANLEGITYVAASGDDGAAACLVFGVGGLYTTYPGSMPGITAVGGSEFPAAAQASPFFVADVAAAYPQTNGVSLEAAWNDSVAPAYSATGQGGAGGGGGGASTIFPKPLYQIGLTPNDGARDVPDVSFTASLANVGYEVEANGKVLPVGGTSAATPSFAGVLAIVNQAVIAKGGAAGLGNVNPTLYALSKSAPTAFHDIVTGNNDVPCTPSTDPQCPSSGTYGGYEAGPGYDQATGLGSIDVNNLVTAWSALTPTTTTLVTSRSATTVGTAISLRASVASTAKSNAVGGTVTFTFETFAGAVGSVYAPDSGGVDATWILGTVPVTASAGAPETGTAILDTAIPPGLYGKAYVVAMYNGDAHYLASVSKGPALVNVTGSTLAITPATLTVPPGGNATLATTGGVPPVSWGQLGIDTSCLVDAQTGAESCTGYGSLSATTAFLQAGGQDGKITIVATDSEGQEATAEVTVAGAPVDGGPFPTPDASPGGPVSAPAIQEGGVQLGDAGADEGNGSTSGVNTGYGTGGSSGSGCAVGAPSERAGGADGAVAALVLGLVAVGRRRRRA